MKFISNVVKHIKEALSDDGVGSYSRLSGATVVVACLFWVTYLVIKTHVMPDLGGVGLLIGGGNTAYMANQAASALSKKTEDKPEEDKKT